MSPVPPVPDSLPAWLARLEGQHPRSIDLGLERVGKVADRLDLRDLRCPVITVGGTNGKGSTTALLVAILRAAGLRVGCYTSPHLLHFNERIAISGELASDADIVAALSAIEAARGDISLTYFEHTTLAAFLLFRQAGLDVAVLEVGMGGRLDAVNLIDADVAVVTSIGIDHVEWLGDTRELIAIEKAGIFRAGRPAICGDRDPPATLIDAAGQHQALLLRKGVDFDFRDDGSEWAFHDPKGVLPGLPTPLLALENAATALAALRQLPLNVSREAIAEGLRIATIAGRCERVRTSPELILDVAHNPQGASFFMAQLARMKPVSRTHAVFAVLADKDIAGVAEACLGHIDCWHVAGLPGPRGTNAEATAQLLRQNGMWVEACHATVYGALRRALAVSGCHDRIVVFGSFLTVAAAKQALAELGE